MMRRLIPTILCLLVAAPAVAQVRDAQVSFLASAPPQRASTTVPVRQGTIGKRQTRGQAAPNIQPLGRIRNRVANRVQNRIRNRVDRTYNPQANATSPFEKAADRVQNARPR